MKKGFIIFILFSCIILSCDFMDEGYFYFDQNEFDLERSKWEKRNIKNYTYIQKFSSNAHPNGKVKITVSEDEEPVIENLDEAFYLSTTISGIYTSIEEAVNDAKKYYDEGRCKAVEFEIIYNPESLLSGLNS